MRSWLKQSRIDLQPRLEVLFGENGLAGGHPADERQPDLLAHGVLELDPPRGARHERDDALASQGPQMLLGGVAERKPSSCAISARVGGIPVLEMKRWMRRRICVWRGVRSDISAACLYIQLL